MSILLLIFRIIGWILLGSLGLILLITGILLFVPLRYKGAIKSDGSLDDTFISFRLSWLFKLLELHFVYDKKETKCLFRILWKKHDLMKDEETKEAEVTIDTKAKADTEPVEPEKIVSKKLSTAPDTRKKSSNHKKNSSVSKKDKDERNIKEQIISFLHAFSEESNQRAIKIVLNELQYICRHYGPRRLQANMTYSLGDPAYTGYILGIISVIPAFYHKGVHIYPDFESEQLYLKGDATFMGHIRSIHLLKSLITVLVKKDTRDIIKGLFEQN